MTRCILALWLCLLVAACGGPAETPVEAAQTLAGRAGRTARLTSVGVASLQRQRPLAAAATAELPLATQLFDFAEANFAVYFPSRQADRSINGLRYRFYPETGAYLVVDAALRIYVAGGPFGSQMIYVGLVSEFLPHAPGREFAVVSGGGACGDAGCSVDSPGGEGVGVGDSASDGSSDGSTDGSADGGAAGAGVGESAVRQAIVRAYKPDGTTLGSAALVDNLVSLYPRNYQGPVILQLVDDGGAEYFDEATRSWLPMQGQVLHAMLPSITHHVSLNPATEAAYQLALKSAGRESALTAELMRQANATVLAQVNERLPSTYRTTDITNYSTSIDDRSGLGTLPNTWAGRWAAVLAGMPIAGRRFNPTLRAPALDYGRQLAADLLDDSRLNASDGNAIGAYGTEQATQLQAGICTAVATWGSPVLPFVGSAGAVPGQLSLLAGDLGGAGNCDGSGSLARLNQPTALARDASGNLYLGDVGNRSIRRVTPEGVVTTLATGLTVRGLAVDASGTVWFTGAGDAISRLGADGKGVVMAGSIDQSGADDGAALAARFTQPEGLAFDAQGRLVIVDTGNATVRRLSTTGQVSTLAGKAGEHARVDGPAGTARLVSPRHVAVDAQGLVYVAEQNAFDFGDSIGASEPAVRRIGLDGQVTTLLRRADLASADRSVTGGIVLDQPTIEGLVVAADGTLTLTNGGFHRIVQRTAGGLVTTRSGHAQAVESGTADGPALTARWGQPSGITADGQGGFYIVDTDNNTLRRLSSAGEVTTVAGAPPLRGLADGLGTKARFQSLTAIQADTWGNLFLVDDTAVRKVTPDGTTTTLTKGFWMPSALVIQHSSGIVETDDLWITESTGASATSLFVMRLFNGEFPRLRASTPMGNLNGPLATARFYGPRAMSGWQDTTRPGKPWVTYVADTGNHAIRRIDGDTVSHLAGNPDELAPPCSSTDGCSADGQPPRAVRKLALRAFASATANPLSAVGSRDGIGTEARFSSPQGIAVDSNGNAYVADTGNHTIRKVTASGAVTTLAGTAGQPGKADGRGAAARFDQPTGIAVDASGQVFVADTGNSTIRRITPDGQVSTVVGVAGGVGNLPGPLPASLARPVGVAVVGNRLYLIAGGAVLVATPGPGGW